jgi:DNA mismatch endonuclease (patch repair protein)
MADVHSPETRSFNMSQIKGKNTKPEELVRRYLFSHGFRYRKNVSTLPGKPDIVLPKYKTCIFVNGCFWHKHAGCRYFVWPKNNAEFWKKKITGNVERDLRQQNELRLLGWNVVVIWECELKKDRFNETMASVTDNLRNNVTILG